jgi:IMP cyclohydrolase
MEKINIGSYLSGNSYPGRGIIIGRSADGRSAVIAYWIMGRSVNSRNRVFTKTDDGIRTEAFDASKMSDPSLIIYHPVRVFEDKTIVTNGDQTDTILQSLKAGHCFRHALAQREFEPDEPNYTPRISGIVDGNGDYKLSILKSNDGDPKSCLRYFFEYGAPHAGEGHFISTYMGDGKPLPSFEGEPMKVALSGDIGEFGDMLWSSLNEDNKVSLFVRYIDIATGKAESRIYNKNK